MNAEQDLFSEAWAKAWGNALNTSGTYRLAAAKWEGPIVLSIRGEQRAVWADLWHGDCREARPASSSDHEQARFVLEGERRVWESLLAGDLDPIWAATTGKLVVAKGRLGVLLAYRKAARELVRAARQVADRRVEVATVIAPRTFQSTSERGLDRGSFPMRLFQKSKQRGVWDPSTIDFTTDNQDWQRLQDDERDVLLHLTSLFQAGEESVTLDLLPLIGVIAREGRLEEEIYLTSFLWEEAKHVEVFRLFLDAVGETDDLARYQTDNYQRIFYEALPDAMSRLDCDASPIAQAEASVTYNMIVEGVLAETGYRAYGEVLERHGILPGMQKAVAYLKADESRHIAFGVYLLARLLDEHGALVWEAIENRMRELFEPAIGVVTDVFDRFEVMPFGLQIEDFTDFALSQFQARLRKLEAVRDGKGLETFDLGL